MKRSFYRMFRLSEQFAPSELNRREFLRLGMAGAAALLSGSASQLTAQPPRDRRVIVVGAGFGGLACAYELSTVGYAVKVFEARKRVGGRIHSLKELIPGKVVEGGGEMLGSNHPHVMAYAAKFEFKTRPISEANSEQPILFVGGRKLTDEDLKVAGQEIEQALEKMTGDARAVVADEPWKTADAKRLDDLSTSQWIERFEISPLAKILLTIQFRGTNGVAPSRQSYLGNLAQVCGGGLEKYWTDTEVARLEGGNQQYAIRMAQELGDERIRLDCPIREIVTTASGVTVIDAAGQRHQADDVVLAIPPSVWPAIKFSPGLPETLMPQMGMNVKYLAVVKERFWRAAKLPPNATTDGEISQIWEGTDGQDGESGFSFAAFSGGPGAESLHQKPVAKRQPDYAKVFDAIYPGFNQQFVKGQFMDWIGDPWTRAGYSFPAPGQVTAIGPILRSGLGRLHFAGEHACYAFVGYMEGALSSGASLAKRIAIRDGITK